MKRFLMLLAFIPAFVTAQNSTAFWSTGFYLGGLNYSGEVTENGDISTWINEMRPQFGINLVRHFNTRLSMGVEASYGSIYAADENRGVQDRDFVVNTDIALANLFFELNFKKFGKYFQRNQSSPFVRLGGGIMFYTPYLNTNAAYPEEYELHTGSWATGNFETAFGWKWRIGYHSFLSADIHYNFTNTSYLEGFNFKEGEGLNPNDGIYGLRLTYSYGFFE